MASNFDGQPIIRGIQAVGAVSIKYRYNSSDGMLTLPTGIMKLGSSEDAANNTIDTSKGVEVAGFRLDGEFLRAVQQIASSVQVPILGGGAVALTNNNRSGTLNINCTKTSTPTPGDGTPAVTDQEGNVTAAAVPPTVNVGQMLRPENAAIGPNRDGVYDLVFLAQVQQAQLGGDSVGATLQILFSFCGVNTIISFEGCTIASVDPLGLAGNDAPNYNVSINYLNWTAEFSTDQVTSSLTPIAKA